MKILQVNNCHLNFKNQKAYNGYNKSQLPTTEANEVSQNNYSKQNTNFGMKIVLDESGSKAVLTAAKISETLQQDLIAVSQKIIETINTKRSDYILCPKDLGEMFEASLGYFFDRLKFKYDSDRLNQALKVFKDEKRSGEVDSINIENIIPDYKDSEIRIKILPDISNKQNVKFEFSCDQIPGKFNPEDYNCKIPITQFGCCDGNVAFRQMILTKYINALNTYIKQIIENSEGFKRILEIGNMDLTTTLKI